MSTRQPEPVKKTGRPAKAEGERRSATVRVGIREALREQIETASVASGRAFGEEIEVRLENSVKLESLHDLVFNDGPAGELLRNIVSGLLAILEYEISPGQVIGTSDWKSSDATRAAIRAMMQVLVNELVPRPRTSAEASTADTTPWSAARETYYNQTLDFMQGMATEMALRMVGKSGDELQVSDPDEASSH